MVGFGFAADGLVVCCLLVCFFVLVPGVLFWIAGLLPVAAGFVAYGLRQGLGFATCCSCLLVGHAVWVVL